jgi:hypothetical protein
MRPVSNWRRVLRHAWSVRLIALVAILNGFEAALNLAGGTLPVPAPWLFGASFVVTIAAMVARLVAQKKLQE